MRTFVYIKGITVIYLYIIYEIRMNLNDVRSCSKVNMKSVLES